MGKGYKIHKMLLASTSKSVKKMDKNFKKFSDEKVIGRLLEFKPDFTNTLDFTIMAQEYYWKGEGGNILFPDGSKMLEKLYTAKFDLEGQAGFDLPFDSFIFGIPPGFEIDGQKIPSFIVTYMDYDIQDDCILQPFAKACGIPPLNINKDAGAMGNKAISIAYQDPFSPCTVHMMKSITELPQILEASTPEEYEKIASYSLRKKGVIKLDKRDLDLQFMIVRLIASLGVYHVATNGERLEKGFPSTGAFRIEKPSSVKTSVFSYKVPGLHQKSGTVAEHVRGWTFRNLKDERYYRGEFKNVPKGSRWVFVDSYAVGVSATPHTQK